MLQTTDDPSTPPPPPPNRSVSVTTGTSRRVSGCDTEPAARCWFFWYHGQRLHNIAIFHPKSHPASSRRNRRTSALHKTLEQHTASIAHRYFSSLPSKWKPKHRKSPVVMEASAPAILYSVSWRRIVRGPHVARCSPAAEAALSSVRGLLVRTARRSYHHPDKELHEEQ